MSILSSTKTGRCSIESLMKSCGLNPAFAQLTGDGVVYNGHVNLSKVSIDEFPVKLIKVTRDLIITHTGLKSLKNMPEEVGGNFVIDHNELTSLEGGPKVVHGSFSCVSNRLKNLIGGPEMVESNYVCDNNELTTLEGALKRSNGCFSCANNMLTSLEHCPSYVGWNCYCGYNYIRSLEHAPEYVGGCFSLKHNEIETCDSKAMLVNYDVDFSYNSIHHIGDCNITISNGGVDFTGNPLSSISNNICCNGLIVMHSTGIRELDTLPEWNRSQYGDNCQYVLSLGYSNHVTRINSIPSSIKYVLMMTECGRAKAIDMSTHSVDDVNAALNGSIISIYYNKRGDAVIINTHYAMNVKDYAPTIFAALDNALKDQK